MYDLRVVVGSGGFEGYVVGRDEVCVCFGVYKKSGFVLKSF